MDELDKIIEGFMATNSAIYSWVRFYHVEYNIWTFETEVELIIKEEAPYHPVIAIMESYQAINEAADTLTKKLIEITGKAQPIVEYVKREKCPKRR